MIAASRESCAGPREACQGLSITRTNFFDDLFRNNEQVRSGLVTFHNYLYRVLELNIPYDEWIRDLITAKAVSTVSTGKANFVARHRIMFGDGYSHTNHEEPPMSWRSGPLG